MSAHIRITSSAAIVQEGHILVIVFDDENGIHYNLPGGGSDPGETLQETVIREIREETRAEVATVGRLLLTWEYEPERYQKVYGKRHKVGFVFACELKPGSTPMLPDNPDPYQVGVKWLPLAELPTAHLYPAMGEELIAALNDEPAQHLDLYEIDDGQ